MKIIFLGTPDFALPSLAALINSAHEILAVITQPDREGDRRKLSPPPVKVMAEAHGIPVYQFSNIRKEGLEIISSLNPDIMVTVAYGQIISREILALPKYGVINVHGSLLPKHRGASPIQQSILSGDKVTGVTIMKTAYEVDSGDIICQVSTPIGENESARELFDRISVIGADALLLALSKIETEDYTLTPQDSSKATFCKMIKKEDGKITAGMSTRDALLRVRAFDPWPAAYVVTDGGRLKIWRASYLDENILEAGKLINTEKGLVLCLTDGRILLETVQSEGGKRMSSSAYALGHHQISGVRIE